MEESVKEDFQHSIVPIFQIDYSDYKQNNKIKKQNLVFILDTNVIKHAKKYE